MTKLGWLHDLRSTWTLTHLVIDTSWSWHNFCHVINCYLYESNAYCYLIVTHTDENSYILVKIFLLLFLLSTFEFCLTKFPLQKVVKIVLMPSDREINWNHIKRRENMNI